MPPSKTEKGLSVKDYRLATNQRRQAWLDIRKQYAGSAGGKGQNSSSRGIGVIRTNAPLREGTSLPGNTVKAAENRRITAFSSARSRKLNASMAFWKNSSATMFIWRNAPEE